MFDFAYCVKSERVNSTRWYINGTSSYENEKKIIYNLSWYENTRIIYIYIYRWQMMDCLRDNALLNLGVVHMDNLREESYPGKSFVLHLLRNESSTQLIG